MSQQIGSARRDPVPRLPLNTSQLHNADSAANVVALIVPPLFLPTLQSPPSCNSRSFSCKTRSCVYLEERASSLSLPQSLRLELQQDPLHRRRQSIRDLLLHPALFDSQWHQQSLSLTRMLQGYTPPSALDLHECASHLRASLGFRRRLVPPPATQLEL